MLSVHLWNYLLLVPALVTIVLAAVQVCRPGHDPVGQGGVGERLAVEFGDVDLLEEAFRRLPEPRPCRDVVLVQDVAKRLMEDVEFPGARTRKQRRPAMQPPMTSLNFPRDYGM